MAKVLDLNTRLQQKKEEREREILKNFFVKTFGDQSPEVLQEIREALLAGDITRYKKVTEPIILRKAMKEFN